MDDDNLFKLTLKRAQPAQEENRKDRYRAVSEKPMIAAHRVALFVLLINLLTLRF